MMNIQDPAGSIIRTDYSYVVNSTSTFTHKLPLEVVGGEYIIKIVTSNGQITPARKLIRIRDYPRDLINVKVDLPLETYRPGDTVSGTIKAELPDGSAFKSEPAFRFTIDFESEDEDGSILIDNFVSSEYELSLVGEGFFSFEIP